MLPDLIITHGTDRLRQHPDEGYREFLAVDRAKSGVGPLPPADRVVGSVRAYINHGRWVVDCAICASAVVAEPQDPVFSCPTCGSGGVWRKVEFPAPAVQEEIERLLLLRPGFRNAAPARNWMPGETVADLRRQNLAAGDPVEEATGTRQAAPLQGLVEMAN
jgi:predicted RNA-binding Zn-ribbon protein involved in translation (DUF1610 family)